MSSQLTIYDNYSTCEEMESILKNAGIDPDNLSAIIIDSFQQSSKFSPHEQNIIQKCVQSKLPILSSYHIPEKIGFLSGVNGYDVKGKFKIIIIEQDSFLRLENFEIGYDPQHGSDFKIPELHVYLSTDNVLSSDDFYLEKIKKNLGGKNYGIPTIHPQSGEKYDAEKHDTVLLYDIIHDEMFAIAKLNGLSPVSDSLYGVADSIKNIDYPTKIESRIIDERYGFFEGSGEYKAKGSLNAFFEEDEAILQLEPFEISDARDPELYLTTDGNVRKSNHWIFGPDDNIYVSSGMTNEVLRYSPPDNDAETGEFLDVFVSKGSGGLDGPRDLMFSPDDKHLLVASFFNNQILRYDAETGEFLDVFVSKGSGGLDGPRDLMFSPDDKHLLVASFFNNQILRYDAETGEFLDVFVSKGSGGLDFPTGISFDSENNLYVASGNTNEILRYDAETGEFLDVFVSKGSGGLDGPRDLMFSPDGKHLFISSSFTDEILRYDADTGSFLSKHVSPDYGEISDLHRPIFGPDGNIYVASGNTNEVIRYNATNGKFLNKFIQWSENLDGPRDLMFSSDGKHLLVTNSHTNHILRYDALTGQYLDIFTDLSIGGLDFPTGISFDSENNLYVASGNTNEILRYDADTGSFLDTFIAAGISILRSPSDVSFGPDGDLYVASGNTNEILRYDAETGEFLDVFVSKGSGGLDFPTGISFDSENNLYVASGNTNEILRYDAETGEFLDVFVSKGSGGLDFPTGISFDSENNLYVASGNTNEILRYDADTGIFLDIFVDLIGLDLVTDVSFGPDGDLYVASGNTNEILRYDADTGIFLETFITAGTTSSRSPTGMISGPDGNIYVASGNTNEILRYDENTGDYLGILVPEDVGGIDFPTSMTIGPDSNLYVVSHGNDKILQYSLDGEFQNIFVSGPELYSPTDLSFIGNFLYVSSDKTDQILRYDATNGNFIDVFIDEDRENIEDTNYQRTLSSNTVKLKSISGLLSGPDGNLYVTSDGTNEILKYDVVTGELFNQEKFIADKSNGLHRPAHLEIQNNKICVSSNFNHSINCYDVQTGKSLDRHVISTSNTIAYYDNSIIGPDGELYMSNSLANEIVRLDGTDSELILQTGDSLLRTPSYLTFHNGYLYVSSDDQIFKFDEQGKFVDIFVTANDGSLRNPQGLFFTDNGLIVNSYNDRILEYDLNGTFVDELVSSKNDVLIKPVGMAVDHHGNIFTTSQLGKILQYSNNGNLLKTINIPEPNCIDSVSAYPDPHGLLIDGNNLYMSIFNRNALMVYDLADDKFTRIYCNDLLHNPEGLSLHDNILYITTSNIDSPSGVGNVVEYDLEKFTFSSLTIHSGNGQLSLPRGIYFHNDYLYIANSNNNEILKYDLDNKSLNVVSDLADSSIVTGGITFGPDDNLFIINEDNNDIYQYDLDNDKFHDLFVEFKNSFSDSVNNSIIASDVSNVVDYSNSPDLKLRNIVFTNDHEFLFASIPSHDGLIVFDSNGSLYDVFENSDVLQYPTDISLTPDGNHILVVNYGANTISRLAISDGHLSVKDPIFVDPGNDGLIEITQIGFDPFENLYVVGGKYNEILKYTTDGQYLGEFNIDDIYLNKFSENLLRHYTVNGIDLNRNDVLVVYDNFLEQSVATSTLNDSTEFLTPITILAHASLSSFNIIDDPDLQSKDIFKRTGFFIGTEANAYGQAIIKNVDQQVLVKIETFSIDYDKSDYLSIFPYVDSGMPDPTVCLSDTFDSCTLSTNNDLKLNAGDNTYLLHDVDIDTFTSDDASIFIHDGDNLLAYIPLQEYGIARISLDSFVDWILHYLPVFPFIGLIMLFPITFDYIRSFFKLIFFPVYWLQGKSKPVKINTKNEKITILIPAHNEEYGIQEAIESALATDYSNKEIIVIDDGSKDDTYLIAHRFAEKGLIKLVHRDTASGSKATALNYGANYATGEYIICMDGDTKLDKDALKNAVNQFDDDVVALSGNVKIIGGDDGITNTVTKLQSYEYMVAIELGRRFTSFFQILLVISGAFGVFKKNFFRGVRTFDKDTLTEDFDLTLKLRKTKKKIRFVGNSTAYTYCPNNMSVWKRQRNRWAYGQFQTLLKNRNILTSKFPLRDKISFLDMFVLDVFLALLFPIGLVVLGVVAITLYLEDNLHVLVYPLFFTMLSFLVLETLVFLYAVAHSGKNKLSSLKLIYLAPVMTFYYRPYLKMINLRAYIRAYLKKQASW